MFEIFKAFGLAPTKKGATGTGGDNHVASQGFDGQILQGSGRGRKIPKDFPAAFRYSLKPVGPLENHNFIEIIECHLNENREK